MTPETAEIVKELAEIVREEWPKCLYKERLPVVDKQIDRMHELSSSLRMIQYKWNDELVSLNRDGQLSVYYTDPLDDTPAMHINLLQTKTIVITTIETVEIPYVEGEQLRL